MKTMRRTTKALVAVAAAVASVVGMSGSASAGEVRSELSRGQGLNTGDMIMRVGYSAGEALYWQLIMQPDGNLVLYREWGDPSMGNMQRRACWATGTYGSGGHHVTYQQDGNFVLYNQNGYPLWASNTVGGGGSTVDLNYRGDLYVGTKLIARGC